MIVTAASVAALQIGYKKAFQDAFNATRPASDYQRVATVIRSTSKSETYGWLGKFPKMREWVGDRVIKDMEAFGYTIVNKDFEATVGVDRNDIEDDNLGVYTPLFAEMGHSAAQQPDDLVFSLLKAGKTTLCFDGQNFFDTDHPSFDEAGDVITVSNVDTSGDATSNPYWYLLDTTRPLKPLIFQERKAPEFVSKTDPKTSDSVFNSKTFLYGVDARSNAGFGFWQMAYASSADLDGDALDAAIAQMRGLRDVNGRPLGIKPNLLVVGPELRSAANKTVKVMLGDGGASNANYNAVEVLDTDWVA
ncbi:Mu-like prophage major head subunit gpT family protein [Maritimibacter sp. HL-12]|uniref:Mu-like prophage major head subunit gpT family protein n=1 Tax=Maritimibacter sp. HL-12 TaxID=1162418 RepID=UPI000A0F1573|nr:Mu-like prophage major head subunit gpT family protein [Maritimibacter sp. HL-12]SMH35904.1 Mu-like prophage major head subunit gpT [Maritimibacter sp. HL-12]